MKSANMSHMVDQSWLKRLCGEICTEIVNFVAVTYESSQLRISISNKSGLNRAAESILKGRPEDGENWPSNVQNLSTHSLWMLRLIA